MAKQSKAQQETVERVMHEFKHHELKANGGRTVRNPKQAIAIALREAGASRDESPKKNAENLKRTKGRERIADAGAKATRADLYAEAKRRNIAGRSKMSREELARALDA
ncbi:hypothetical protein HL658_00400 [Azospirillum sp. RWY-5-1]|uniref:Rho termination factor n=1 Tax=Azospirillum oleiclasticum TaxID=2735135 RepID=A0ABX2T5F7_9PROT|nr:DUF6496 domain-containing protein [Azospirillum oleiclasticum]NYZ10992.1 hypothetical protein [Azospirillum oleiclasticum]NYZ18154.1 hypothetical protein [Azospirillum oleiclasticum]